MAKIKLTLPLGEIPVDGKQVSFVAPCDCSAVDGIQIDGVDYDVVDSAGNVIPFGRGVWSNGAVLSVILDVTNRKAYLQNQNAYTRYETMTTATAALFGLGADAVPDDALNVIKSLVDGAIASANEKAKVAAGSYTGTGTSGASNQNTITTGFPVKMFVVFGSAFGGPGMMIGVRGTQDAMCVSGLGSSANNPMAYLNIASFSDTGVSFYSTIHQVAQFNQSGAAYQYIAFG